MIPKFAIEAYLEEPRDDHRWIKKLTHDHLDKALSQLNPPPKPYKDLRLHQKASLYLGIAYPQFAFYIDMGGGKTLVSLELLKYWWGIGRLKRALIFVKSDKAFPTWEKQIKQYNIGIPFTTLEDSSERKWRTLESFGNGLILVAYPGVTRMVTEVVKKKNKNKLVIDPNKVQRLANNVQAIVMDESTCVGHHGSLAYKLCEELKETINIRYALAGRPFGRDPLMLWAQQFIIDGGESLGETLGLFRAAFYSEEPHPWTDNEHIKSYSFDKRTMPSLMRLAHHRSISYGESECGDLPKLVPMVETIRLPEEAKAYYKRVVDGIISARGNLQEMKNAFMRMRQLSSGFLGFRDEESGERAEIAFEENPKLDRLLELLDDLPRGRKALVFYDFTFSGRRIHEALKARKQSSIWIWSGTKNYKQELAKFQEDPNCEVAVLNNRIGAYSLDGLQVANYVMFYESPVSVIDREQAERRARRSGQTRRVFQYDLVVQGTLDQKILDYHSEGASLLEALRANPEDVLK